MMRRTFRDYVLFREGVDDQAEVQEKKPKGGIQTSLVLGKGNDYKPFVVTDDPRNSLYPSNKNLAPLIRAFKDSRKVRVYDSIGKGGETKPHTLSPKSLFLVGGAVRDHLRGKTPKSIDLVTDATPDEIRMILSDSGFQEDKKGKRGGTKTFSDKNSSFRISVNGQEFDLETFKNKDNDFAGHRDDASRRDLTVNSLYLALTNDDGPNNQLTDFHGGVHDMEQGEIRFIGNASERLDEDPSRALNYALLSSSIGGGKTRSDVDDVVKRVSPKLKDSIHPTKIRQEFIGGLEDEDVDPAKFLEICKNLGLLDVIFPGLTLKFSNADDYPNDRDRSVILASLLRGNDPNSIRNTLDDGGWDPQDIERVGFLHNLLGLNSAIDPDDLDNHLTGYRKTGILGPSAEKWWKFNKKSDPHVIRAFLDLAKEPRVSPLTRDDMGYEVIDPDFEDLFDPISRQPMDGVIDQIGRRKKHKEHAKFLSLYHGKRGSKHEKPEQAGDY